MSTRDSKGAFRLGCIAWLAWRDFAHDRRLSACQAVGLAAVLGPLLVLFGLKFGVVETMTARLREQPRIREIVGVGNRAFAIGWFEEMERRPDVAFVIPRTRTIAASVVLEYDGTSGTVSSQVELVPTAAGDPLLAETATALGPDQAVLSTAAATRLGVGVAERVTMLVSRVVDGRREQVRVPLHVVAIAPEGAFSRQAAFVSLALLSATEAYRDGFEVAQFGWAGAPPIPRTSWAGFRLYARSILDVGPLQAELRTRGLDVRTSAAEIDAVLALDGNLTLLFWAIAVMGGTGCIVAIAASLSANAQRKRREMGVLRLLGFSTSSTTIFPAVQATLIGALGSALAWAAFWVTSRAINVRFRAELETGEALCTLGARHVLVATLGAVGCALVASIVAGRSVARIDPSEVLREV